MNENRCIGLLGSIFGHKFIKTTLYYEYQSNNCYRCGMPKGGWPSS